MSMRRRNALSMNSHAGKMRLLGILVIALDCQALGCVKAPLGNVRQTNDGGTGEARPQADGKDTSNPNEENDGAKSDAQNTFCDPFSNFGCSGDQKCSAMRFASALVLNCGSKGSKTEGDTCTPIMPRTVQSGDDCGDGLACLSVGSETNATCHRICPISGSGNSCPGSEPCSVKVGTFADLTGLAFCQGTTTCLPLEQTGCSDNEACYYADKVGAICAPKPSAPVQPGGRCVNANDCAQGSTCVTIGSTGTCFTFCSTTDSGTCPSGMTCSSTNGSSDEAYLGTCR